MMTRKHIETVCNFALANPQDLQDVSGMTDKEIEAACKQIVRDHNDAQGLREALRQAAAGFAVIANHVNTQHPGLADNQNLDSIRGFAHENFCIVKHALNTLQKGDK